MTGSLKKNDKEGIQTRPDYRGKITLQDNQEFWLSAWINTDRETGQKYMSLKLTPKEEQNQFATPEPAPAIKQPEPMDMADDDIPF